MTELPEEAPPPLIKGAVDEESDRLHSRGLDANGDPIDPIPILSSWQLAGDETLGAVRWLREIDGREAVSFRDDEARFAVTPEQAVLLRGALGYGLMVAYTTDETRTRLAHIVVTDRLYDAI